MKTTNYELKSNFVTDFEYNMEIIDGVLKELGEKAGQGGGGIDYSFEEQWTGRRWIDGKKIYQKTVDCGALPEASQMKRTLHDIVNLKFIIHCYGMALNPDDTVFTLLPTVVSNPNCNIGLEVTSREIVIENQPFPHWVNYTESYVTLLYTCTDR